MSTATISKNTGYIADPVQTTEDCRFCWMCRHICPVGHVTASETLTPHGWGLTISSVKHGTLQWNADSVDVLYKCADCGMCRTHCVTDRPLPDAVAATRAELVSKKLAPAIVYDIDEKLKAWGNPYGLPPQATAGVGAGAGGATRGDVALFVGDAAHHLDPAGLAAARALLDAAGLKAVPIGVGRSSGLLASSLGLPDTAAALAREVIDEVKATGCREVLVLSAGDHYAFKKLYLERLNLAWPEDVAIRDVASALAEALTQGRLRFTPRADAQPYTYVDPDHAPRIGCDGSAPRALLAAALGGSAARHTFWRELRAHPTGAVGGLEFTQPAIASKLTDARIDDAISAGASWVIADEASGLRQLRTRAALGAAARNAGGGAFGAGGTAPPAARPANVEVFGLYELLNEHLAR